eukprot:16258155-Heterocapsa_arctica.AAC.1
MPPDPSLPLLLHIALHHHVTRGYAVPLSCSSWSSSRYHPSSPPSAACHQQLAVRGFAASSPGACLAPWLTDFT